MWRRSQERPVRGSVVRDPCEDLDPDQQEGNARESQEQQQQERHRRPPYRKVAILSVGRGVVAPVGTDQRIISGLDCGQSA